MNILILRLLVVLLHGFDSDIPGLDCLLLSFLISDLQIPKFENAHQIDDILKKIVR